MSQNHIPGDMYFREQRNDELEVSFTYLPEDSLQERWRNFLQEHVVTGKRGEASNRKRIGLDKMLGKKI